MYKRVHKLHHKYINTVSIAVEYTHPVEYLLGNIIPAFIPAKILGGKIHFYTFFVWILYRLGESVDGHCGYAFSWSPFRLVPFSNDGDYHDFHHSHNVGNYSSFFSIWDGFFGTNREFYKYKQEI
jgi:sterol desaturase/sphingolipid hydroxylase (fatty acid hydroxylase superfamily)